MQQGAWTFGRRRDGFVAPYSWREARFLAYDPTRFATDGMVKPFDLVAQGGADNVWIVECGSKADWPSFAAFRAAVASAPVEVLPRGPGTADGVSDGFDVTYGSPSRGRIELGWDGPLVVEGREVALDHARWDNPFVRASADGAVIEVAHEGLSLRLDFAAPARSVARMP
ncbi:MAG: hypothetical protein AB1689_15535 [Thermodesulfobacteriota bacterium]